MSVGFERGRRARTRAAAAAIPLILAVAGPWSAHAVGPDTGLHPAAVQHAPFGTLDVWGDNGTAEFGTNTTCAGAPDCVGSNSPVAGAGLTGVTSVTGGADFGVALKSDGTVWAWGDNAWGQLGTTACGSGPPCLGSKVPVQVGAGSVVHTIAIAAGTNSVAALQADGTVWTWGANVWGQLGNGTFSSSGCRCVPTPAQVGGLTDATAIAAGDNSVYVVKKDGTVWGWGANQWGQLASAACSPTPCGSASAAQLAPAQLSNVVSLSSGDAFVAALKSDGTAWTWGGNRYGQLGQGFSSPGGCLCVPTPAQALAVSHVVQVASHNAAYFMLFLRADGTVWGAGDNGYGEMTSAVCSPYPCVGKTTPAQLSPATLTRITSLAVYNDGGSARRDDGTVWVWGAAQYGQLGNGTTISGGCACSTSVVQATGLSAVATLGAADSTLYALMVAAASTASAWGDNGVGQMADGAATPCAPDPCVGNPVPYAASGITGIVQLTAGASFGLALKSDGTVWGWGDNSFAQLTSAACAGVPCTGSTTPIQLAPATLTGVVSIAAGAYFGMALRSDGTVWTWGDDHYGQLGNGTTVTTGCFCTSAPVQVSGLTMVAAVAAGGEAAYALLSDGTVWAWGDNAYSEQGTVACGADPCAGSTTPVQVASATLTHVVRLAAGRHHAVAVQAGGALLAWGSGHYGQLGNGTTLTSGCFCSSVPVTVSGLTGVSGIASGVDAEASFAVRTDGTVWAWGDNGYGQLGRAACSPAPCAGANTPQQVMPLTQIAAVVGGGGHAEALRADGTAWGWGDDRYGQLGDAVPQTTGCSCVTTPVRAQNIVGVTALAAGDDVSLAVSPAPSCATGGLSVAPPAAIDFGTVGLNGLDHTQLAAITISVNDQRGSAAGWAIDATSTTFSAGANMLPTTAATLASQSVSDPGGACLLPTDALGVPVTVPAAAVAPAPAKIFSTAPGTGQGPSTLTLTFNLLVPANSYAGAYASTWTLTIASSP